jgi:inhibitor of cysteine peptidase
MKRRLASVLVVVFVVGCATGTSAPPIAWQITEADAGTTIRIPVGTVVDVALPGNPRSGYIWQRRQGDSGGIEAVGAARFEPAGGVPGQGGLIHLQFRVVRVGATVLWLAYQRPFQSDAAPERTFSLTIVGEATE